MDKQIEHILIVGGGSAGWIAAARIASRYDVASNAGIRVTLIESNNVGTVGVGEGTWPTMRNTLRKCGISETEFLRSCDATFKQGARFNRWTDGSAGEGYYHPLNPPQGSAQLNLSGHWMATKAVQGIDFANAVDFQAALCDAGLAPKSITTPEYSAIANYAYHLDAVKFAAFLRDHCVVKLGVRHVIDDVIKVVVAENGDVSGLDTNENGHIEADMFIDCSGFSSLIIGQTYGVPFVECHDVLFCDSALAMQVPYALPDDPIATHTISTAQSSGWIWDIGLPTRKGIGHVYSSAHISHDQAEAELRAYIGPQAANLSARRIPIRSGYRQTIWVNNCVAVGLSGGFLEPLEASALMLIEKAVDFIADRLPRTRSAMHILSKKFNISFEHHWMRIVEFLKLHYVLTKREDSDFWRDNRRSESVPDGLAEKLKLWRHHPPSPDDFTHANEVFSWPSYQYVMHGMGFDADYGRDPLILAEAHQAARWFAQAAQMTKTATSQLPRHRDLIDSISRYGLQSV